METVDFDEVLNKIWGKGWYQLYTHILTGLGMVVVGMQCMANVFISGVPAFQCADDISTNPGATNASCRESATFLDSVQPLEHHRIQQDMCHVMKSTHGKENVSCDKCSSWIYDQSLYGTTTVSTVCKISY